MIDYRPRAMRILDAIFEAPQSEIDAFNLGVVYSGSEDGAEPDYATTDTSAEADRFWEGCEAGTKARNRKFDALFGPEGET